MRQYLPPPLLTALLEATDVPQVRVRVRVRVRVGVTLAYPNPNPNPNLNPYPNHNPNLTRPCSASRQTRSRRCARCSSPSCSSIGRSAQTRRRRWTTTTRSISTRQIRPSRQIPVPSLTWCSSLNGVTTGRVCAGVRARARVVRARCARVCVCSETHDRVCRVCGSVRCARCRVLRAGFVCPREKYANHPRPPRGRAPDAGAPGVRAPRSGSRASADPDAVARALHPLTS